MAIPKPLFCYKKRGFAVFGCNNHTKGNIYGSKKPVLNRFYCFGLFLVFNII